MIHCPCCERDSMELMHAGDPKVELDRCRLCGGLWFDQHELEILMDEAVQKLRVPQGAEESERVCPRDGQLLSSFFYPQTQVRVDMCRKCKGLWLDGGELAEIKRVRTEHAERGTLKKTDSVTTGFFAWLTHLFETTVDDISDLADDVEDEQAA